MILSGKDSRIRRGYTITELLVVMMIIAIASTVAILSYGNVRRGESVYSAAEKVRAAMINARTRSIALAHPTALVFDLDNHQMWIDDLSEAGAVTAPKVVPPEQLHLDVVIASVTAGGTTQVAGRLATVFRPDGTNQYTVVHLRRSDASANDDSQYHSVQLYPSSAEPRIWENARR